MKKSTKGALAASAAGILLLGGAGSLAYWTADGTADGGSVSSGELKLSDGTCDATWVYGPDNAQAGQPVALIVPGDVITKDCDFEITAKGDNLAATPTLPATITLNQTAGDENPAPTLSATAAASYSVTPDALVGGKVTSLHDGDTLTAAITVTFPYGNATTSNANDTQNLVAQLDTLTVSLVQDDPNA